MSLGAARITADQTAAAAGVSVTEPGDDIGALRELAALFAQIWGLPMEQTPIGQDTLRSLEHAGSCLLLARAADGQLVGGAVAVHAAPAMAGRSLYGLIAGTRGRDGGVGRALKQAQRAWALDRGINTISWTFDPLVSRNGHVNLSVLGATARSYTPDFYGPMADAMNRGDVSDRLTAMWDLAAEPPASVESLAPPVPRDVPDGPVRDDAGWWIAAPADVITLRRTDHQAALDWRRYQRAAMTRALAAGAVATACTRTGWYLFTEEGRRT